VAMIDRRPYEQQKQEPYVVGSCQVLEDHSGGSDGQLQGE